jgi:hypothetical protein
MTRELIGAGMLLLVAVVVVLIYLSNRSIRRSQESLLPIPKPALEIEHPIAGFYVSTVFSRSALTKVWAHGLGSRGKALLAVTPEGVSIQRQGEVGFLIPAAELQALGRASATIDKAVEKDGLTVLVWQLGEEVATHLRIVDPKKRKDFEAAVINTLGVEIE